MTRINGREGVARAQYIIPIYDTYITLQIIIKINEKPFSFRLRIRWVGEKEEDYFLIEDIVLLLLFFLAIFYDK